MLLKRKLTDTILIDKKIECYDFRFFLLRDSNNIFTDEMFLYLDKENCLKIIKLETEETILDVNLYDMVEGITKNNIEKFVFINHFKVDTYYLESAPPQTPYPYIRVAKFGYESSYCEIEVFSNLGIKALFSITISNFGKSAKVEFVGVENKALVRSFERLEEVPSSYLSHKKTGSRRIYCEIYTNKINKDNQVVVRPDLSIFSSEIPILKNYFTNLNNWIDTGWSGGGGLRSKNNGKSRRSRDKRLVNHFLYEVGEWLDGHDVKAVSELNGKTTDAYYVARDGIIREEESSYQTKTIAEPLPDEAGLFERVFNKGGDYFFLPPDISTSNLKAYSRWQRLSILDSKYEDRDSRIKIEDDIWYASVDDFMFYYYKEKTIDFKVDNGE